MKNNLAGENERSALIESAVRDNADMIYRIAYQNTGNHHDVNKCHDLYRHKKRTQTEPLDDYINTPSQEKDNVLEEIFGLPEKYRTVIYLYYYENFTLQEIANTLGKKLNTVSSDLQRARKKLKKILTEEE